MNERVIESKRLSIKLLNGSIIKIRPLTLAERKQCISLLPTNFSDNPDKFVDEYMNAQVDIIHFIISRENKSFKKSDVEKLLDASLIEEIIQFTLKDPFNNLLV